MSWWCNKVGSLKVSMCMFKHLMCMIDNLEIQQTTLSLILSMKWDWTLLKVSVYIHPVYPCCRSKGGQDQRLYGFEFKFFHSIIPEVSGSSFNVEIQQKLGHHKSNYQQTTDNTELMLYTLHTKKFKIWIKRDHDVLVINLIFTVSYSPAFLLLPCLGTVQYEM